MKLNPLIFSSSGFEWIPACSEAFQTLKEKLVSTPVLFYPWFGQDEEFILETDASGKGLGAIFSQCQDGQIHPIAYASRSLDKHERNYGISELETLGLVWAVRYFRPYILGHHTTVYTDHAACTSLLKTARPSRKLARWALAIQEMNLTIRHRPGKKNGNADALSQNPAVLVGVVEADGTGVSGEVVWTGEAARSVVGASDEIMSGSGLVEESEESDETEESGECGDEVVAEPTPEKLLEIRDLQQQDPSLVVRCRYLEHGQLPDGEQESRKLVLESRNYEVMQGVLYYEPPTVPGRLRNFDSLAQVSGIPALRQATGHVPDSDTS